jgi:hypothetical protein
MYRFGYVVLLAQPYERPVDIGGVVSGVIGGWLYNGVRIILFQIVGLGGARITRACCAAPVIACSSESPDIELSIGTGGDIHGTWNGCVPDGASLLSIHGFGVGEAIVPNGGSRMGRLSRV